MEGKGKIAGREGGGTKKGSHLKARDLTEDHDITFLKKMKQVCLVKKIYRGERNKEGGWTLVQVRRDYLDEDRTTEKTKIEKLRVFVQKSVRNPTRERKGRRERNISTKFQEYAGQGGFQL